jgi:hypothetical protein
MGVTVKNKGRGKITSLLYDCKIIKSRGRVNYYGHSKMTFLFYICNMKK